MNWESTSISFDEGSTNNSTGTPYNGDSISEENEQKRLLQLQNFSDQKGNTNKTTYHAVMSQFGQLMTANTNKEEIVKNIFTEDCEIFVFNFADATPAQYAFAHEGFIKLFTDKRVIRREVKETYVSLQKSTGFQVCECEVADGSKGSNVSQFSFEIFSFRGTKLCKYRVSYGSMPMSYNPSSLFMPTQKERALVKVKELNYFWADHPDLEKIASLLPENAEYKFYRWKDKQCFTFNKHNVVSDFKKCLEEDFIITSIVPYGISHEAQYIFGSYVYHLEGIKTLSGQKFIWVSTCIYSFDQDCNIKKISQQGELYPEGETLIPFQVQSKEKLLEKFLESTDPDPSELSIFGSESLNFSFDILAFGFNYCSFAGHIKGFSQLEKLKQVLSARNPTPEKGKVLDVFEDLDDPCYDSVIIIESKKGMITLESCPFQGKPINLHIIKKYSFENGKLAKIVSFPSAIPDPIPSPFDDTSFHELNFRPKSEFLA